MTSPSIATAKSTNNRPKLPPTKPCPWVTCSPAILAAKLSPPSIPSMTETKTCPTFQPCPKSSSRSSAKMSLAKSNTNATSSSVKLLPKQLKNLNLLQLKNQLQQKDCLLLRMRQNLNKIQKFFLQKLVNYVPDKRSAILYYNNQKQPNAFIPT
nr:MAG: hypothetical protein [Microvirus sp.]